VAFNTIEQHWRRIAQFFENTAYFKFRVRLNIALQESVTIPKVAEARSEHLFFQMQHLLVRG